MWHQLFVSYGVMNVNRELGFAERLAKSVRQSMHPTIDRQREDVVMGLDKIGDICQNINFHHQRQAVKISEVCVT